MDVKARQKLLKTFNIDYTSDVDDVRYQGSFTTKKLSIADTSAVGVRKSQLNGGMYHHPDRPGMGVDEDVDNINAMIAHMQISLVTTPKWWDINTLPDMGLLSEVYKEVAAFENSFHNRRKPTADNGRVGPSETNSNSDISQTNSTRESRTLVESQVQDPFEL